MAPLAQNLDLNFFLERLAPLCFSWLHDPVYRVRYDATINLKKIVQVLGVEFYHDVVHLKLLEAAKETNYLYRSVVLWTVNSLSEILPMDVIGEKLLPIVMSLVDDPVSNIKLNVITSLEIILKRWNLPSDLSSRVQSVLRKFQQDKDLGVRECADHVLNVLSF
eukprot:TRINITY_DN2081_c0_g1_i27.p1 TRINITY_DN2081_c0_g1~~TRINITY_DN2081_c0_g1_i27.p1  ORF type:complete len:191 (-),score=46.19 TRINITY_DN2081_c0_g1_i27:351-842(-)